MEIGKKIQPWPGEKTLELLKGNLTPFFKSGLLIAGSSRVQDDGGVKKSNKWTSIFQ